MQLTMRFWKKFFVGLVVILVLVSVLKDQMIKRTITTMGTALIGAPLTIDGFSLGLLFHKIRIKGLKLYNPDGFPLEPPLLNIPQVSVDFDLTALLRGEVHISYMIIDVKQMTIIKNKEGQLNVEALKVIEEQKKASDKKEVPDKKNQNLKLRIDYLRLSFGEVIVKDYQKSDPPVISAYTVGIFNKEFREIKSAEQLLTVLMVEGIRKTGLKTVGVYAAASVLGVSFLPVGIATVVLGNDNAVTDYDAKVEDVFEQLIRIIEENNGKFKRKEKTQGIIKAVVQGCDVAVKLAVIRDKTKVTISARKYLIPKPEIAGGIMHQLSERIK